ncbi:FadR/GntR family transcriptional regulator [Flavobacterium sp. UMI-01]|uniref:FadR/GntR family transcriptional regulator n=1 Tax=Flavobacterium sp. UMI-01 TaxID=1441053 RepID=UPI0005A30D91|nr:FadR/GntR family transcriptional regulator [Flavobacterium sp. UMI-01]BAQ25542.1 GntR-like transcription factor [Flavobacterium sp. UMI-01]GIZ07773.1 GntR family transcriptional regulator [Flavobacterium sp. UMI-01]
MDNYEIQNLIISKIRDLIIQKNLEPGDKLPSERVLSERFKVSRRNINEAIKKLEFYELVKSIPQSGTFIATIGQTALNGIIEDILKLRDQDFKSLVETRILLESKAAGLAAARRTEQDLESIEKALNDFKNKMINKQDALQEDLLFHLAITRASGNMTMNALMLQITPKIISVFENNRVCNDEEYLSEIQRHEAIFEAIKNQDVELAVRSMENHFKMLVEFCSN